MGTHSVQRQGRDTSHPNKYTYVMIVGGAAGMPHNKRDLSCLQMRSAGMPNLLLWVCCIRVFGRNAETPIVGMTHHGVRQECRTSYRGYAASGCSAGKKAKV